MSKGAAHCGVSQSAASQHVQEVERRLGIALFDRSKRPVELTAAGKLYNDFCRDVLRREEELQVAVPPSHAFARRAEVYPTDLNGQTFVGFDEDLSIRHELDRFFREQGVEVNLAMHFDNIQTIKEAVALGTGISILP